MAGITRTGGLSGTKHTEGLDVDATVTTQLRHVELFS